MSITISSPKQFAEKFWSKITKPIKASFFSALIIGFLTHAYGFINLMPNHDGVSTSFIHYENMTYQGRWFQKYASLLTSSYSMPWVNGCISILILAVAVAMVVYLFNVKKPLNAILISGFMVTFPTITSSFAYLYMTDAFMFALLFAVLAVFISRKIPKWGFLLSAVFINLSLGIYQSYICLSVALYVSLAFIDLLEKKKSIKEILIQGVKDIISLLLGVILYMVILKILLAYWSMSLIDYQDINQLNNTEMFNILSRIKGAFIGFYYSFKKLAFNYNNLPAAIVNMCIFVVMIIYIIVLFIKKRLYKNIAATILFVMIALLFPMALNSMAFLSAYIVHLLMVYSMCLVFVMFVKLGENFSDETKNINFKNIGIWVVTVLSVITIFSNYIVANKSYLILKAKFNQTYAYATKLSVRIESSEDYHESVPIAISGFSMTYERFDTQLTGFIFKNKYIINDPKRYYNFLRDYIGISYTIVTNEILEKLKSTEEYKAMPLYPMQGSIDMVNGVLVVKLS